MGAERSQEHELFEAALLGAIDYMKLTTDEHRREVAALTAERDELCAALKAVRAQETASRVGSEERT